MDKVLYTAEAFVEGGRAGHGRTSDGRLDVALSVPESLGGEGGTGTNPEQLFAVGYAACFQSALMGIARGRNLDASDSRISSRVGLGPTGQRGFTLSVSLDLHPPRQVLARLSDLRFELSASQRLSANRRRETNHKWTDRDDAHKDQLRRSRGRSPAQKLQWRLTNGATVKRDEHSHALECRGWSSAVCPRRYWSARQCPCCWCNRSAPPPLNHGRGPALGKRSRYGG